MSHDAPGRNHGGGMPLAAITSRPLPTPRTATAASDDPITLSVPRPDYQRSANLYVDTPFQHRVQPRRPPTSLPLGRQDVALVHGASPRLSFQRAPQSARKIFNDDTATLQKQKNANQIISSQPTTFTKELLDEDSIICGRCGRCKCEACTTPRKPGGFWMCGGKCLCSPTNAVDYLSCLCCVRGVMYHCGKDCDDQDPAVDTPCACVGPNKLVRWACLAVASIPLPCLLCYWPLEVTRRLCEGTYRRFSTHGCKCQHTHSPDIPRRLQPAAPLPPPPPPEKRLLQHCA